MEIENARKNAITFIKWYETNNSLIKSLCNLLGSTPVPATLDDMRDTIKILYAASNREEKVYPVQQKLLGIRYNCPLCDYSLVNHANYCSNCGQAINWRFRE